MEADASVGVGFRHCFFNHFNCGRIFPFHINRTTENDVKSTPKIQYIDEGIERAPIFHTHFNKNFPGLGILLVCSLEYDLIQITPEKIPGLHKIHYFVKNTLLRRGPNGSSQKVGHYGFRRVFI